MTHELICISCPRGCHLKVDDELNVSGNLCPRGAIYAKQEVSAPMRTITSTALIKGAILPVCPLKSASPIPKEKIFDAMKEINALELEAPINVGDVLISNVAKTGVAIIATRSFKKI